MQPGQATTDTSGGADRQGAGTGSATTTQSKASARERRYEQLLRENPPPASVPAPRAKPSLFERLVAPIAAAFGMNRTPPAPAPAAPPKAETAPTEAAQIPSDKQNADDRGSDIVQPVLLGAEFLPPEIQDGEQTIFSVTANDESSGVRSVSGVILNPTGSTMGFACRREGASNRFVTPIVVPKDAAEGMWVVRNLTIVDFAGNTTMLDRTTLPPGAAFKVRSSGSDAEGPTLSAVWLDRPVMRAGERNSVHVVADDDRSGVLLVSGGFVSPSKRARITFNCRAGQNNAWDCPLQTPVCLDCGVWLLEQVHIQDKAGNTANFRADNDVVGGVRVDISADRCDSSPPVVTALAVDPPAVSNVVESVVRVTVTVIDDGCGFGSLNGQAVPPGGVGGQRSFFSVTSAGDGQTYTGSLVIRPQAAKGIWAINWLQVSDKGMNTRAYSQYDSLLARATFEVK